MQIVFAVSGFRMRSFDGDEVGASGRGGAPPPGRCPREWKRRRRAGTSSSARRWGGVQDSPGEKRSRFRRPTGGAPPRPLAVTVGAVVEVRWWLGDPVSVRILPPKPLGRRGRSSSTGVRAKSHMPKSTGRGEGPEPGVPNRVARRTRPPCCAREDRLRPKSPPAEVHGVANRPEQSDQGRGGDSARAPLPSHRHPNHHLSQMRAREPTPGREPLVRPGGGRAP